MTPRLENLLIDENLLASLTNARTGIEDLYLKNFLEPRRGYRAGQNLAFRACTLNGSI